MSPTERKPLISGNWKMHHNHFEALQLVQKLLPHHRRRPRRRRRLGAPFRSPTCAPCRPTSSVRRSPSDRARRPELPRRGQGCVHRRGVAGDAGEARCPLRDRRPLERRELFGETDDQVNAKVHAILRSAMTPILCCGETLEEREAGSTESKVTGQVQAGLAGLSATQVAGLVVAYEPIWAIGTGRTPVRRMRRPSAPSCGRWWPAPQGPKRPPRCGSSTAVRSSRPTRRPWASPTSTGPWWAGQASRPTILPESSNFVAEPPPLANH